MQQPQVAFQLLASQSGIEVAAVLDEDAAVTDGVTGLAQTGQNLFVNAILPADVGVVAEQPHLADECSRAVGSGRTLLQDVGGVIVAQVGPQLAELGAVGVVEIFIGVEPEEPLSRGMANGFIAGGCEIIAPGKIEHLGLILPGDLLGVSLEPVSTTMISSTM